MNVTVDSLFRGENNDIEKNNGLSERLSLASLGDALTLLLSELVYVRY